MSATPSTPTSTTSTPGSSWRCIARTTRSTPCRRRADLEPWLQCTRADALPDPRRRPPVRLLFHLAPSSEHPRRRHHHGGDPGAGERHHPSCPSHPDVTGDGLDPWVVRDHPQRAALRAVVRRPARHHGGALRSDLPPDPGWLRDLRDRQHGFDASDPLESPVASAEGQPEDDEGDEGESEHREVDPPAADTPG